MAERSYVFNGNSLPDAGPYSDSDWWELQKYGFGHGGSRPNGGVMRGNGVYVNSGQSESLVVSQTAPASAAVALGIGSALIDGSLYVNDSALTLTIAANGSGSARIDTVILRKTVSAGTVRAVVLQGTPAGTPVPTALTQTAGVIWEIPIAYVTVASGFVTIVNANVTQSMEIGNANNVQVVDDVLNNSAITLEPGMIVVWDLGSGKAVTTTVTSYNRLVAGVWLGRTAAGARGRLQRGGTALVKFLSAPTAGQFVVTSTTVGSASGTSFEGIPNIGRVIEATGAAGLNTVQLDIDTGNDLAVLAANRLGGVATPLDSGTFIPFYNEIEVEFYLRSETAATTDAFLFRFGDIASGFDATATNYFSYAIQTSGAGPTATPIENLGAAAGIRVAGPGATAGANLFVSGKFRMWDVRSTSTRKKNIDGRAFFRVGNLTGNLAIQSFGGNWENATIRCEQVRVVTVSGANLSADSQILVRAIRSMALP